MQFLSQSWEYNFNFDNSLTTVYKPMYGMIMATFKHFFNKIAGWTSLFNVLHTTHFIHHVCPLHDANNLQDLVFRERHLQQNVVKLEFKRQEVRNLINGKFKHMLELRLFVAPNNLWKGPRSYIWKHLGQNEWRKENGSTVVKS